MRNPGNDSSLFAELYDAHPQPIVWLKPVYKEGNVITDFEYCYANDEGLKYLNLTREQFKGLLLSTSPTLTDALRKEIMTEMTMVVQSGGKSKTDVYNPALNKHAKILRSKLRGGVLMVVQERSEEFRMIQQLEQQKGQLAEAAERLQAVFNAAQAGMFIFAPVKDERGEVVNFRFVITNPTFAAYVQQTPEVLQGALGSDYFPGYLHNGVFDMYKQTYLTGETLRRDVHYQVDGHDLYLDLQSTKLQDEVLVTFNDYTLLKKAGLQLERGVEDLKRSNQSLEEFAHAASHDLKEPIRKIRVFADRLQSSLADRMNDEERNLFERMQSATSRMTLLLDDLLSYSHLGFTLQELDTIDLNKKLGLVCTDLEVQIEEKKAQIVIDPLPVVKGYRRQLQQLFQNLISNALKYSKPDVPPHIHIQSRVVSGTDIPLPLPEEDAQKTYHLITVTDNGIGLDQQYADRIFQMFQRLHGRSEYSGTGIGLAIARKVVTNHHGYIWVESEPGKGAIFNVVLPE